MKCPVYYILMLLWLASCAGKQREAETSGQVPDKELATETPAELPLPTIPESLNTPEARAAYLALHFWDGMDFTDHALSLDTAFMEQNFANYLSVFPVVTQETERDKAVGTLLRKAAQDSTAAAFLLEVVDKYLRDPNSPMRDETLLIVFYEQILQIPDIPESCREHTAWLLDKAMKNRPGSVAADFTYLSRRGTKSTLHARRTGGPTLLIFYDPDCEQCKETLQVLVQMPLPYTWSVLAIDAERDKARWDETKVLLPASWEVGFATTDLTATGLYELPALPILYLLDGNYRVLLKDPTLEQLAASMASEQAN